MTHYQDFGVLIKKRGRGERDFKILNLDEDRTSCHHMCLRFIELDFDC